MKSVHKRRGKTNKITKLKAPSQAKTVDRRMGKICQDIGRKQFASKALLKLLFLIPSVWSASS